MHPNSIRAREHAELLVRKFAEQRARSEPSFAQRQVNGLPHVTEELHLIAESLHEKDQSLEKPVQAKSEGIGKEELLVEKAHKEWGKSLGLATSSSPGEV